jgi:hypothetical protein
MTKEQFVNIFKLRSSPEVVNLPVKQGEFQTVMPWWAYGKMNNEDLEAIYEYLRTVPPVKNSVTKFEIKLF